MEEFWHLVLISTMLSGDIALKKLTQDHLRALAAGPEIGPKSPNYKSSFLITSPPEIPACPKANPQHFPMVYPGVHSASVHFFSFKKAHFCVLDVPLGPYS